MRESTKDDPLRLALSVATIERKVDSRRLEFEGRKGMSDRYEIEIPLYATMIGD